MACHTGEKDVAQIVLTHTSGNITKCLTKNFPSRLLGLSSILGSAKPIAAKREKATPGKRHSLGSVDITI
jgi:hypothetical protein